jgi:hypothetical protein
MVATGSGGGRRERLDSKGALRELHDQPFGTALLVAMAIGLIGYALWRFVEAAIDPERQAPGTKGIAKRIGWALGGLVHAALVVYAVGLITGDMLGSVGGRGEAKSWSARLMRWDPYGAWIIGGVGLFFLGAAVWQGWCAWRSQLDERLDLERLRPAMRRLVIDVCRFGIAARAFVSALIGAGLVGAAFRLDPNRVQDVAETLDKIRRVSFGPYLLIVVAFGLAAYGVYELIEARFRRIRPV